MRNAVLGTLGIAGLVLGTLTSPASAAGYSDFAGGCVVVHHVQAATAQLAVAVVVYTGVAAQNPVTADVTCSLVVNGTTTTSLSWVANPVTVHASGIDYAVAPSDDVQVCTTVDYTSNSDYTDAKCLPVVDTDRVVDAVYGATAVVDPTLCPILAAQSPGIPGVVDIDPTGDTYVLGGSTWDCPPYGG